MQPTIIDNNNKIEIVLGEFLLTNLNYTALAHFYLFTKKWENIHFVKLKEHWNWFYPFQRLLIGIKQNHRRNKHCSHHQ